MMPPAPPVAACFSHAICRRPRLCCLGGRSFSSDKINSRAQRIPLSRANRARLMRRSRTAARATFFPATAAGHSTPTRRGRSPTGPQSPCLRITNKKACTIPVQAALALPPLSPKFSPSLKHPARGELHPACRQKNGLHYKSAARFSSTQPPSPNCHPERCEGSAFLQSANPHLPIRHKTVLPFRRSELQL